MRLSKIGKDISEHIYIYHGIDNIHVIRGKQRLSRTFNIFTFQPS